MREVAALAGVSLKTVSRVVNAEPGVSVDVRQRVERAVLQLGYRHNLAASNLRRINARTNTVGALLQDVSNSFSSSLLRSLEDTAHERGVAILASSLDEEPDRERSLVASLVRRRVDGLVLMPATDRQDYLSEDLQSGLPVVFVDRRPQGIDADSVTADNLLGSRLAAHHLVAQGHSRIAFLGDLPTIQTAADRYRGFIDGLSERSLVLDVGLAMSGLRTTDAAQQALLHVLDGPHPPTAVFAARNSLAVGAVRALRQRGLSHRIALVGFDDFPLADVLEPGLTVIRQNVGHIGREVSRALFARIDGDQSPPRHVVVAPELVVRGSGEISPPA
jgi:LacI family transcriptional regulator